MKQRGRKSGGELATVGAVHVDRRPEPPVDLTPEQSDIWAMVVGALPADWFPAESWPLLAQYCRHTIEARRIAQLIDQECARPDLDVATYAELLKLQKAETTALKAMAASMRISQQSRRTDNAAATAAKNRTISRPWEG